MADRAAVVLLYVAFLSPVAALAVGCTPAMVSALTGAGAGLLESTVRAEAAAAGADPNAPAWKAAIDAAAKADRKHANALADAEKRRDAKDAEERRREHAEVMAALRALGARDAGAEGGL
jgi:hypothetical protein